LKLEACSFFYFFFLTWTIAGPGPGLLYDDHFWSQILPSGVYDQSIHRIGSGISCCAT